jgi:hypothetical protein
MTLRGNIVPDDPASLHYERIVNGLAQAYTDTIAAYETGIRPRDSFQVHAGKHPQAGGADPAEPSLNTNYIERS